MRTIQLWNEGWVFEQEGATRAVTLPHTWNAQDGTDGGNDYYRGNCWYRKEFKKPTTRPDEEIWVEFGGAAMTAEVSLNGKILAIHEGGYSTFRANLTDNLLENNVLTVAVNNGKNRCVYPQKADFTFYGGLYRDVKLITVPNKHFELGFHGAQGIKVTPMLSDDLQTATVTVKTWHNATSVAILLDGEVQIVKDTAVFTLQHPHLWNGKADPHLYTATATLPGGDEVSVEFGIRNIGFDAEQGFSLNNKPLRLCGVARHQDRQGLGSALTKKEHEEDLALMLEMGANTVRLAHYQHDQYFYDLCDKAGLVVWAEIPYISEHMPEGRNTSHHHGARVYAGRWRAVCVAAGHSQLQPLLRLVLGRIGRQRRLVRQLPCKAPQRCDWPFGIRRRWQPTLSNGNPRKRRLDGRLSGALSRASAQNVERTPLHLGNALLERVRFWRRWT